MPFPPGKEGFDLPTQLVDLGDLFDSEIKTVGANPIGFALDRVTDKAKWGLCLIHPFSTKKDLGVIKDDIASGYGIGLKTNPTHDSGIFLANSGYSGH